uniref:Immunoglobulin V-set domain-containing protein n=1 Tax=Poecilia formosa TaxID=48698 RepID=A0A096M4S3_POEFO
LKFLSENGQEKSLNMTVFIKAAKRNTICNYPDRNQSKIQFRCKSKDFVCEDLSPQSYQVSNKDSPESLYSCKMEESNTDKRQAKLILKVTDIVTFTKSPIIGENLDFFCKYDKVQNPDKFVCKGEDPIKCENVTSTKTADENSRFTMVNNNKNGNITITMKDVRANDSGTYWCGTKRQGSRIFISRLLLNVDLVTTPTSPTPTTTSGTSDHENHTVKFESALCNLLGSSGFNKMLFTVVYLTGCLCSDKAENRSGEHPREDCIYEEIPDDLQTKVGTVYATVNFSPNDPASMHYCTINFQSGSTKTTDGEAQIVEPSSSSYQYSAIKLSQNSASLSGPPTKSTGKPLYSAVKEIQQI